MNSGYEQPAGPTVFVIYGPNMSSNVTPRPERVYGMCNRRVAYVHQGFP